MAFTILERLILALLMLACRKHSFTSSCTLVDSIDEYNKWKLEETFIYSSLWINKETNVFWLRPHRRGLVSLLLLIAGDVESCPGPVPRKTCLSCHKTIRKNQRRAICINCNETLHLKCLVEELNVSTMGLTCQTCLVAKDERREQPAREDDGSGTENECFAEFKSYAKARGLGLYHQNVCGLVRVHDQLKILLHEVQNIDLFAVSESHLNPDISNAEIAIPGYELHRLDRQNGPGGGVAVYVKENMSSDNED